MKSEDFPRLRFGIGRPPRCSEKDLCEYVLEDFTHEQMSSLNGEIDRAVQAIDTIVFDSIEEAMNKFNQK